MTNKACRVELCPESNGEIPVKIGDVECGHIIAMDDGFYAYWPPIDRHGCFPSWVLYAIAQKLDELNAPLEREIEEYFRNHP